LQNLKAKPTSKYIYILYHAVRKILNSCYFKRFLGNTNYKSTKEDIIVLNYTIWR